MRALKRIRVIFFIFINQSDQLIHIDVSFLLAQSVKSIGFFPWWPIRVEVIVEWLIEIKINRCEWVEWKNLVKCQNYSTFSLPIARISWLCPHFISRRTYSSFTFYYELDPSCVMFLWNCAVSVLLLWPLRRNVLIFHTKMYWTVSVLLILRWRAVCVSFTHLCSQYPCYPGELFTSTALHNLQPLGTRCNSYLGLSYSCALFLLVVSEVQQAEGVEGPALDVSGLQNVSKFSAIKDDVLDPGSSAEETPGEDPEKPDVLAPNELIFAESLSLNSVTTDGWVHLNLCFLCLRVFNKDLFKRNVAQTKVP